MKALSSLKTIGYTIITVVLFLSICMVAAVVIHTSGEKSNRIELLNKSLKNK